MTLFFVTGTGTEIGKTWVATHLAAALTDRGRSVLVRKPAQSFTPAERGRTDADLLAAASGDAPTAVCPTHRWYELPMAPVMAADALGRAPFSVADLAAEIHAGLPDEAATPAGPVVLVEGAGGPRSPLASDGDNVDLARALGAGRAVLVADAGLGTINAVRLCVDALSGLDTLVFLNRFDDGDLHRRNRAWLQAAGYVVSSTVGDLADAVEIRLS